MANEKSSINVYSKGIDPTLAEVLANWKNDILMSTNCHAIAKVQSFNKANQTCTAKMNYSRTFFKRVANGKYEPYQVEYPVLIDMPAISLRGGKSGIRFPIKPGDDALVCFNDRDIDNWFAGKNGGGVATSRMHSFSDGIAIVGLSSKSNPIPGYENDGENEAVFYNEDSKISVKPDEIKVSTTQAQVSVKTKIKIENNARNLQVILQELMTQLQALSSTIVPAPGNPLNPAVTSQLANIAIKIGELLE